MARPTVSPTGHERYLAHDDLIVSKTDLKGHITYANRVFLEIADYTEEEVLGQAHNMIRHPDMPRTIYHLLWERLQAGRARRPGGLGDRGRRRGAGRRHGRNLQAHRGVDRSE